MIVTDNAIGLGIILSLQDRASAGLESIRSKLTALRDVSKDMMKQFDEGAKQMLAGFASMATGAKVLGLLNSTFGLSVHIAADFEQAMAGVRAVSGATGETLEALTKQAKQMGRDTVFTSMQAAHAQENLIRAGLTANEVLNSLPSVLNMASAEGMDLAEGARIMSETLTRFELNADQAHRIANVFSEASRSTSLSIASLSNAMSYAGTTGHALGMSLEEVSAWLGILSNSGFTGSRGGTNFRGVFSKLIDADTLKKFRGLGIAVNDAVGNTLSPRNLLANLNSALLSMDDNQVVNTMQDIFGRINYEAAIALAKGAANSTEKGFDALLAKFNSVGDTSKEMSDIMVKTLPGAMKLLDSATEGLKISIGNHLLPVYTWAIVKMAEFKSWLAQLIEEYPTASKAVIGLTTALIGLSGVTLISVGALASIRGMIKMWPLLKLMAVSALSNIKTQARLAFTSLSALNVPVVAMIALAGTLYYAWRKNLWGIRDMVTAVSEGFKMALSASIDGIAEVDKELANKLKAAGIWDFAVTMGKVFFRVRQFWYGLIEGIKDAIDVISDAFEWFKELFAPAIESGQALMKFLGILKPVTKTYVDTWKGWGQLLGRLIPLVLGVIAAFKGFNIITGIVGTVGQAIMGMFKLISAHPVIAAVALIVAAGIYLYTHWNEISKYFAVTWDYLKRKTQEGAQWIAGKILAFANKVENIVTNAANWVKRKWQGVKDWWNSLTLKDIFAPVLNWASSVKDSVLHSWQEFSDWWDSWTLGDIFDWLYDSAVDAINKVKQPFIDFKNWIVDLFANLNPFNWELPSWLGGGKAGDNQVRNSDIALSGYMPPEIPATSVPMVNVSAELLPPTPLKPQSLSVTPEWAKGMEDLNARMGLHFDVPSVSIPDWAVMSVPASPLQSANTSEVQNMPIVNVAPANPNVNLNPTILNSPVVQHAPVVHVEPTMLASPIVMPPDVNIIQQDNTNFTEVGVQIGKSIQELIGNLSGGDVIVQMPVQQIQAPSSPLLIQHSQNKAAMNGQANVQAQALAPDKPVNVNNHVDLKIEAKPGNIFFDGEKVGAFSLRWFERQNIRNGVEVP